MLSYSHVVILGNKTAGNSQFMLLVALAEKATFGLERAKVHGQRHQPFFEDLLKDQ
jgi:hypothetical protein